MSLGEEVFYRNPTSGTFSECQTTSEINEPPVQRYGTHLRIGSSAVMVYAASGETITAWQIVGM